MSKTNPTREDFAALLEESFVTNDLAEGSFADASLPSKRTWSSSTPV
jgi:hypothetical protein